MSTKPALQTPGDVLETPQEPAKANGLLPRSSVFYVVLGFVGLLLVMAIVDITSDKNQPQQQQGATANATGGTAEKAAPAKLGPAPPPIDILNAASAQAAKGETAAKEAGRMPLPDDRWNQRGNAPEGVKTEQRPGAAVGNGLNRKEGGRNTPASGPTGSNEVSDGAAAQRSSEAAISGIFAITGGGGEGVGDAIERTGMPGAAAVARAVDPIQRQMESYLRNASAGQGSAQDPTADLVRVMAGMQGNANAPRASKDQAFLDKVASQGTAEAMYAKDAASPWMIFQGTRIPIVTREAINSDAPAQITAISTAPVYDSINQCAEMIPAGTKFIGAYSSDIRPGQTRAVMAYRRMIFPDGRSVDLEGAQAVDQQGAAGADANVNNHFLQMFGYGFAVAWLADKSTSGGAGVTVTQPNGSQTTTTIAGQVLADTANRIMSRNAVIPPTLTLPVGMRMFVTVVRDVALTPTSRKHCK